MSNKKEFQSVIDEEIEGWQKRVFFPDVKFKENTPADLELLKNKVIRANFQDEVLFIASETEGCVYKMGRFLIELGVNNRDLTFLDGDIMTPYIDLEAKYRWQSRKLIDDLLDNISSEVKRKWVLIPELNCEWNKELSIYFVTELKKLGPAGVIFFSNKNSLNNLAQVLVEETYTNILQFPKERYSHKKEKHLAPDEY